MSFNNLRIIGTTPRNNHCDTSFVGKILSPCKVSKLKPTSSDLSTCTFPFFDFEAIEGMKSELPTCFTAAGGVTVAPQFDPCEWWKYHSVDIPMWARIALIQPSSAAAERIIIFTSP